MAPSTLPSVSRPRDTLYVLFLLSYIPTIIFFDAIPLYPPHLVPAPMASTHAWYLSTFKDPLITSQPAWFRFFSLVELVYQLPASTYLAWALAKGRAAAAAVHMVVWAVVCAGTTATCLYEFWYAAHGMGAWERNVLSGMYGGYGIIFIIMGVDMFFRVQKTLAAAAKVGGGEKKVQ